MNEKQYMAEIREVFIKHIKTAKTNEDFWKMLMAEMGNVEGHISSLLYNFSTMEAMSLDQKRILVKKMIGMLEKGILDRLHKPHDFAAVEVVHE